VIKIKSKIVFTTALIASIALGAWFLQKPINHFIVKRNLKKEMLSEKEATYLYALMQRVHALFTSHNIPYFIDYGTLLGAVRNKGLIPYDNDLDIGILKRDLRQLHSLISRKKWRDIRHPNQGMYAGFEFRSPAFKDLFIYIHTADQDSSDIHLLRIGLKKNPRFSCDIFVYEKGPYKRLQMTSAKLRQWYPLGYYAIDDVFTPKDQLDLTLLRFGPTHVYGFKNHTPYLNQIYPGWERSAVVNFWYAKKRMVFAFNEHPSLKKSANYDAALYKSLTSSFS